MQMKDNNEELYFKFLIKRKLKFETSSLKTQ